MKDGFDETAFKEYLSDQFPEPMSNPFTRKLIDNILDHAQKNYHVSKDMFVNFLAKMIPEITFSGTAADPKITPICLTTERGW